MSGKLTKQGGEKGVASIGSIGRSPAANAPKAKPVSLHDTLLTGVTWNPQPGCCLSSVSYFRFNGRGAFSKCLFHCAHAKYLHHVRHAPVLAHDRRAGTGGRVQEDSFEGCDLTGFIKVIASSQNDAIFHRFKGALRVSLRRLASRPCQASAMYDRVAITRSDLQWIFPHPPLEALAPMRVWLPDTFADDYGGVYAAWLLEGGGGLGKGPAVLFFKESFVLLHMQPFIFFGLSLGM